MKIRDNGLTDVLEMRGGGGMLVVFGLPFLGVGLFVLGMGLGLIPVKNGPPVFFSIPFGSIFVLVGLGLVFGRRGCRMDKKRRTIQCWSSLIVPLKQKLYRFEDFTSVSVTREVRRSDKSTYIVFPVRLRGEDDTKLDLQEFRQYPESRALAEQVAKFLELPFADSSAGAEVVRAPDELDLSLKERVQRSAALQPLPEPPSNLQTRILRKDRSVRLEIPPGANVFRSFGKLIFIPIAIVELVVLGVALNIFFKEGGVIGIAALVLIGVFSLVFLFVFVRKVLPVLGGGATRVTVTDRELRVERRSAFGSRVETIPADELEELLVAPTPQEEIEKVPALLTGLVQAPIVARSDTKTIQFGGHLPEAEKEFLAAVILNALGQ
ncbi:MAG: hypothetical protein GXP31_14515 [Kiritimatiellaeota bacterium]|nr:hypothetical protein [Kiritimatiellota bacterium]